MTNLTVRPDAGPGRCSQPAPHNDRENASAAGRGQQRKHPQLPKWRGQRVRTGRRNHRRTQRPRPPRPPPARSRGLAAARPAQAGRSRQRDRDIQDRRLPEATAPTTAMVTSTGVHVAFWLADANHPSHTSAPVRTRTNATRNRRTLSFSSDQRRIRAVPARSSCRSLRRHRQARDDVVARHRLALELGARSARRRSRGRCWRPSGSRSRPARAPSGRCRRCCSRRHGRRAARTGSGAGRASRPLRRFSWLEASTVRPFDA